jgi:SAM-dependent methyltransferase
MTVRPRDYDSDPDRFLSDSRHPHDDVHPYVAARFAAAGARQVLDVGGGSGQLVDLSPTMLALAPRPSVRADGARLPVADGSVDAVAALYTLYHYEDPRQPVHEARRVLRSGGLFAACAPARDSAPELADIVPDWGARSTFDAEDAPDIVASVFGAPGDRVEIDGWDGPLRTLSSPDQAAGFLRCHGMSDAAAHQAAAALDLPLTLTMRGCVVYATKG